MTATAYTWTLRTFICAVCKRRTRVSQEALAEMRKEMFEMEKLSDATVVEMCFEFCLECVSGIDAPGEHDSLCWGQEDEHGEPTCTGIDVKPVAFRHGGGNQAGEPEWYETEWCVDCRNNAIANGYEVAIVGADGVPVVNGKRLDDDAGVAQ